MLVKICNQYIRKEKSIHIPKGLVFFNTEPGEGFLKIWQIF